MRRRFRRPHPKHGLGKDPRYARAAFERAKLLNEPRYEANFHWVFKEPKEISIVRLRATSLADLDLAILLAPDYGVAYLLRANVKQSLIIWQESLRTNPELWESIRADFTQAIRIDPANVEAYIGRGRTTPSGEDGELADYDRAVELAPEVAQYRLERGRVWQARGELDRAIADFDEAIRLTPGDAWYHQERAEAFRARGDYGRSEEDLARVRDINSRL